MAKYSFALSDKLCKEYFLFKQHDSSYDKSLVSKLLSFHTGDEFIYNHNQIDKIGVKISDHLYDTIKGNPNLRGKSILELSKMTVNKLILTDYRSDYPYVNINNDIISTCVIGCLPHMASRDKAISHIKSLLEKAKRVVIYDKFLADRNNLEGLKSILIDNKYDVLYFKDHISDEQIDILKTEYPKCTFKERRELDTTCHDRYIEIDGKIEILLSSGFGYINDNKRDLTYVIRPITNSRF